MWITQHGAVLVGVVLSRRRVASAGAGPPARRAEPPGAGAGARREPPMALVCGEEVCSAQCKIDVTRVNRWIP